MWLDGDPGKNREVQVCVTIDIINAALLVASGNSYDFKCINVSIARYCIKTFWEKNILV